MSHAELDAYSYSRSVRKDHLNEASDVTPTPKPDIIN